MVTIRVLGSMQFGVLAQVLFQVPATVLQDWRLRGAVAVGGAGDGAGAV